jgi:hypothetical protein
VLYNNPSGCGISGGISYLNPILNNKRRGLDKTRSDIMINSTDEEGKGEGEGVDRINLAHE